MDAIYLCDITALEYWFNEVQLNANPYHLLLDTLEHPVVSPQDCAHIRQLKPRAPTDEQLERLACSELRHLTAPFHLLVAHPDLRRNSKLKTCHVWQDTIVRGAFVQAGHNVYVSSPAFCFVQLAQQLSLVELIQLGCELTGAYTPSSFASSGIQRCRPLTTNRDLASFVGRLNRWPGIKVARRAARYVLGRSASPRETLVALRLSLPGSLGCHHLPPPMLKQHISMDKAVQSWQDGNYCLGDLTWPEHNLVLEYDSTAFHADKNRLEHDAARRNRLGSTSINVVTATSEQVTDFGRFDVLARQTAAFLGRRLRFCSNKKWLARSRAIHRELAHARPFVMPQLICALRGND